MSLAATLAPEPMISAAEPQVGKLYEVIDGLKVEKPPMGNLQVVVASNLDQLLGYHARSNRLGRVVTEMLFKLNVAGGRKRRPDVAFVSYTRWARERKIGSEDGWDVIPDLAIEVISPSNPAEDMLVKVDEYFQSGVLRVWVVYPSFRQIYLYESSTKVEILKPGDDLEGGDLLPGFRLPLVELFEDGPEG